ncbi:hypothetical protein EMCRGX_G010919 [Ephydatia muelleri]
MFIHYPVTPEEWEEKEVRTVYKLSLLLYPVVALFAAVQSPGDIVIPNWSQSRSAALDIKVTHTLKNSKISDACQTSGASAAVSEEVLWVVSKEAKSAEVGCSSASSVHSVYLSFTLSISLLSSSISTLSFKNRCLSLSVSYIKWLTCS